MKYRETILRFCDIRNNQSLTNQLWPLAQLITFTLTLIKFWTSQKPHPVTVYNKFILLILQKWKFQNDLFTGKDGIKSKSSKEELSRMSNSCIYEHVKLSIKVKRG